MTLKNERRIVPTTAVSEEKVVVSEGPTGGNLYAKTNTVEACDHAKSLKHWLYFLRMIHARNKLCIFREISDVFTINKALYSYCNKFFLFETLLSFANFKE